MASFTEADQLARLRVAVRTGRLPKDLGAWLLDVVRDSPALRTTRDQLIRETVRSLKGSDWERCRTFLTLVDQDDQRVRTLLQLGCSLPTSWRQVHRIAFGVFRDMDVTT